MRWLGSYAATCRTGPVLACVAHLAGLEAGILLGLSLDGLVPGLAILFREHALLDLSHHLVLGVEVLTAVTCWHGWAIIIMVGNVV